jgi:histidinol phosphatase-like enzyme (inositol monophosphatase family)
MRASRSCPTTSSEFDIDRIGGVKGLRALEDLVRRAGDAALKHFQRGVVPEKKPDRSPVTVADREAEQIIRDHVLSAYPEAGFLGEETGSHGDGKGIRFIVDPIDGTRAFVRGWATWSVLLGIEAEGVPVAGLAYMPADDDFFAAVQGNGTTHNGTQVRVSKLGPLADATVTHGGLQQFTMTGVGEALIRLAGACDIARGCPDFDGYRQVLLGRSDAMVDPGVQPYDVCAPAILIREAGGRFTSLQGEETIYGGGAIASNGVIHDELVAALSSAPYR